MGKSNKNRAKQPRDTKKVNRGSKQRNFRSRDMDASERSYGNSSDRLGPLNDMSWYNHNPLLTQAAASIPFPYRPGMDVPLGGQEFQPFNIPGVMQLGWLPFVGYAELATDPINIAAKEVYAKVRGAFSGSLEADPPDFMVYFMALDSIFSYIGHLKRVFRILNTYTPMNYMIPDVLLQALGCGNSTINNLKNDRMKFFQVINELVGMTHKFTCPAVFDIFNRHYWMSDNVYADAESANSQLYVFNATGFYQFTLVNTPDGVPAGGLTMKFSPLGRANDQTAVTVAQLYAFGKELIDALAQSEDAYTISGYLTRAYDGSVPFRVDEITLNEPFNPVYVPEVLAQIENAWALNAYDVEIALDKFTVSQNPKSNVVISTPKFDSAPVGSSLRPFLSIRSDAPSVSDVIECTRLKTMVTDDLRVIAGTEVLATLIMYCYQNYDNPKTPVGGNIDQIVTVDQNAPTVIDFIKLDWLVRATVFDWHPLAVISYSATGTSWSPAIMGDIHNFTTFSKDQLIEINKICLYS